MPRLTLQRKVFLALTALLVALLVILLGLSRFGLQRGLGEFVAEIELSRMDWLAARLEDHYAAQGHWDALQSDAQAWHRLQMRSARARTGERPEGPRGPPPGAPPGSNGPPSGPPPDGGPGRPQLDLLPERYAPPPPPDAPGDPRARADMVYARLLLLDATGTQRIAGAQGADLARLARMPLSHAGRTVGWLAIAPLSSAQSAADRAFLAQQSRFIALAGLAGLVLALLISWWITRRWLSPVHALAQGAQAVAAGRLDTQVPVHGDDELAMLSESFNTMAARLAHIERTRQEWLADVAHELRTPLAAMRAEIEALQDGVRRFDAPTAERLHRQVMRLGQLVEDLRLSLRNDAEAGAALQRRPVQPVALLHEAVEVMHERLTQAGIAVDASALADAGGLTLLADAARLHQVFANLLENTLRYTHAGGRLVLAACVEAGWLQLDFDDTAPAPPAADLPHLFERFHRAEASRSRDFGGAGLGLAICKALIEAHGGRITAAPSAFGGLQVRIALPLAA